MNSINQFSKTAEICAIAVGKTEGTNTHCGLLYSTETENGKSSFFLHLGNPLHLYNDNELDQNNFQGFNTSKPNFLWLPFSECPTQFLKLIRSKCIIIAKKNNALPYGVFHDEETFFDAEGNLILGQDSNGLTCATFVKVVLKGCGVNVLDDKDWPEERETDEDWLNGMIEHYKEDVKKIHEILKTVTEKIKKSKDAGEIAFLKLEKTKILSKVATINKTIQEFREGTKSIFKRYRPEELSASSFRSYTTFPIQFEYPAGSPNPGAGFLGEELLKILPDSPSKIAEAS
jgi:hypothetical protein